MSTGTLWPNYIAMPATRGMAEMLYDAAAGLPQQTGGRLDFYVDTVGVGHPGGVKEIRYNCYLMLTTRKSYKHLLFQVTAQPTHAFPATLATPEGEEFRDIPSEADLRTAIDAIVRRERTKEVVLSLMNLAGAP